MDRQSKSYNDVVKYIIAQNIRLFKNAGKQSKHLKENWILNVILNVSMHRPM